MNYSVLLVEDEKRIREVVADYFIMQDCEVYEASNGQQALALLEERDPKLVILDIMLPGLDGWTVCREIRTRSTVPIILLTAKSEEEDKLLGFHSGADDYVTKPFSPRVLVARANALIKRLEGQPPAARVVEFGTAVFNLSSRRLEVEGTPVELTGKEFDILQLLVLNKGIVVSREMILQRVWDINYEGDPRVVDTHIKKLRSKLGPESGWIRTIVGTGYKFEESP